MITRLALVLFVLVGQGTFGQAIDPCLVGFRGDVDSNDSINISDVIYLSNYLAGTGPVPQCFDQSDANNDGSVDAADGTFLLNYLFAGGPSPGSGPEELFCP